MKCRALFRQSMVLCLVTACALSVHARGANFTRYLENNATPVGSANAPITLDFQNADIQAVATAISAVTGKNLVVDTRVKGVITLVSEKPVSPAAAMRLFLASLRLQGFTVVETDGVHRIMQEADAKLLPGPIQVNTTPLKGVQPNQIITQIFKLNFESANNLVPLLRPLISPNNTINVNPGNNSLIITDYADNLRRITRIIEAMDVSNASQIEVIPLQHSVAIDLAPIVLRLLDSSAPQGSPVDVAAGTVLIPELRSNSLIVRAANPARLALAKSLIQRLDRPNSDHPNGDAGNMHVVYLRNAEASKLAVLLRAALSGLEASAEQQGGGRRSGFGAPGEVSTGSVQADTATNSLIIYASEPQYRQLRAVIDKLDARRAQVYVETLIAEVNADKAAEFGVQWQGLAGTVGDATLGLMGTNFGTGGKNIVSAATATASTLSPGRGLNIGAAQRTNGVYVLGFLARFLEESGSGNVLSKPNLLTLDNEEAKIVIGQNVPFVTGQFSNTGSSSGSSVNPFQTIERKDVGLTLKVKPQISEDGTVRLKIYQEVSSVLGSTVNSANGPTTNKRTIESSVLVQDGSIVVLGGLLQDDYAGNEEKVPGLGDVSFFGNLFKSEARSRKKTNLMVFLHPIVVRDAASTQQLSTDRYELMRSGMRDAQPTSSVLVPINASPELPALP